MPATQTPPLNNAPVGIFDSGVGGLSVLQHIRTQLPHESLCYFADSGFAPYGEKSEADIMQRTLFAARHLLQQGVKAIVVACNTATAAAISTLRTHYPELIIIGVEPGLKPAASLTKTACVGVLATTSTLASQKYQLLSDQLQQATHIQFIRQACPGLVTQIELGDLDGPITRALLNTYLQPLTDAKADVIVLGCTHYPFIADTIRQVAAEQGNPAIQIVDTGLAISRQLQRLLEQHQLQAAPQTPLPLHCMTTGSTAKLQFVLSKLLHFQPDEYQIQEIDCNFAAP